MAFKLALNGARQSYAVFTEIWTPDLTYVSSWTF